MSSESHHTSDLAAQGGQTSVLRRRSWRKLALASLITLLAFTGAAYGLYLKAFADADRCRSKKGEGPIRHGRRSRRSSATRLHHDRRQMATTARPKRCRSALPQDAVRIRGQALLQPPRHRSESGCSRCAADGVRPGLRPCSCGSTVTWPITVTGSTGLVLIGGDTATGACAANFIVGPVSLTGNTAGVEVNGNMVIGPLNHHRQHRGRPRARHRHRARRRQHRDRADGRPGPLANRTDPDPRRGAP